GQRCSDGLEPASGRGAPGEPPCQHRGKSDAERDVYALERMQVPLAWKIVPGEGRAEQHDDKHRRQPVESDGDAVVAVLRQLGRERHRQPQILVPRRWGRATRWPTKLAST